MEKQEPTKKRSRPPSPFPHEASQKTQASEPNNRTKKPKGALAAVMEKNNRLKALHEKTLEHERLKVQVDAMTEANMEKVNKVEQLKKQIATQKDKLATTEQEVEARKETNSSLTIELQEKQHQLKEIHDSWQQQVADFQELQALESSIQNQYQAVQEKFQNNTHNLIAERQRRKQLQERLEELRKAYESQGMAAHWHSIVRGGSVSMTAVKKDCS